MDKNDQVYISDFGLAKSFAEGAVGMTQTGAFLGTPRYMSPEQVEGKPTDGRSDLYAYGLILYEMVTGDVPFTGESTLGVMYQRIQEKPKSPKLVNPSLPNWFVTDHYALPGEGSGRIVTKMRTKFWRTCKASNRAVGLSRSISRSGSSIQIQLPEFASRRWIWVTGAIVCRDCCLAISAHSCRCAT